MDKFFYTITNSFDYSRRAIGPFPTRVEAWESMVKDAHNEQRIQLEENGNEQVRLDIDEENGEILLATPSLIDEEDITTWTLFEDLETMPEM